jgi:hypothetical protein
VGLASVLVPATVALVGYWLKDQAEKRLAQERDQSDKRLEQQRVDEQGRLQLDAAMRAATLLEVKDGGKPSRAASASGLLALTRLGQAELAVALLVDLWSLNTRAAATAGDSHADGAGDGDSSDGAGDGDSSDAEDSVSTETAILVINAALRDANSPNAQLVAAELLCRNSTRLDPCQSLHWPAAIDGRWLPELAPRAKILIMEGLVDMTTYGHENVNALRSIAVRLYGIWSGDPHNDRVRGCVGRLIKSLLGALRDTKLTEFMQARETVTLEQLERAAEGASPNPDGFLERLVAEKAKTLEAWSKRCAACDFKPGRLAAAMG